MSAVRARFAPRPHRPALAACLALALAAPASARIVPDSTVLARVADRVVTAGLYIDNWVAGNATTRPARPDSAGRREFLDVLVNRELMRLAARIDPRPLDLSDRAKVAEAREQALRNALYVRLVSDSLVITDEDIRHMHRLKSEFLRVRRITVRTEQEAAGIRARLLRGEPWSELVKLSVDTSTVRKNGDLGLQGYLHFRTPVAWEVYKLKDGAVSAPLFDRGFWHLYAVDSRIVMQTGPPEAQYRSLREEVRRVKEPEIMSRHEARLAQARQVQYKAENLAFAARELSGKGHVAFTPTGPELNLDMHAEFAPEDTARVLATSVAGPYTLGRFVADYEAQPALSRPVIQAPADMIHAINRFLLPPYLLELAIERGMEKDPYFLAEMERFEDALRIERLYADSVERHVLVSPQDRRRYYEKNKNLFFTYTREHLFVIHRPSRQWTELLADSLRRKLIEPGAVVRRDSLLGRAHWSEERIAWSNGPNDFRAMFNEMKDGEIRVVPGEDAGTVVVRIEQIPGHQLAFAEVERAIDENLRNQRAEDLLNGMLARLRRKYPVTLYTDDLMDLDLTLI